jgi:hypothetical protein
LTAERIAAAAALIGLALLLSAAFVGGMEAGSRFLLQDYGASGIELALSIGLASRRPWVTSRTPNSVWIVFLIGVAAAFASDVGLLAWWLLARTRGLLSGAAVFSAHIAATRRGFVLLLIVAAFFCVVGASGFQGRTEIAAAFRRATRPGSFWAIVFGVPLALTLLAAVAALASGYFLLYPPLLIWAVFFALLFAGRRRHLLRRSGPTVGLR